ncbi:unnamed protein product [Schistocephalus solidus]|uniref:Uncharacterized protein n=1 Tax=Schistocephalus solidus TaxID=70667 RepID=A0A3P7BZ24_SCHSO|nr:unnamed protein product [Schistocephalus solidus]
MSKLVNHRQDRDRGLKLFPVNEEFIVCASHELALITSLPYVRNARQYYGLNGLGPKIANVHEIEQEEVCDALRCLGLRARYNAGANESGLLVRKGLANWSITVMTGIRAWNCSP